MAKVIVQQLVKLVIFWLLVFALARLFFLGYNHNALHIISFAEIIYSFAAAIHLDIAAVCYLFPFTFICLLLFSLFPKKIFIDIHSYILLFFLICVTIISTADAILFNEWRVKINFKALTYLSNPSEVINSAKISVLVTGVIIICLQSALFFLLYKKYILIKPSLNLKRSYTTAVIFFITMPLLIGIGLRGGIQQIPINQSNAYFSKHNVLNASAVNSFWNLGQSVIQNSDYYETNPYYIYSTHTANKITDSLNYIKKDTTAFLFNIIKPNLVLIIFEGWSADVIGALGGMPNITPRFDNLCKQGYLFDSCYATGTLSDQGIVGLLSGFPAQPTTRIIRQPDKFAKLPCISKELKNNNYTTSFYFGGDLNYGNIKGYLYYNDFDNIVEGKDLPTSWPHNRLSYHDGYTLSYWVNQIKTFKQPFFSTLFTASTHSPYGQPMQQKFTNGGDENDYINSIYYADSCLGNFMQQAQKQAWYKNTIFLFISDHSHTNPMQRNYYEAAQRRIPFLIYGEPLKQEFRGQHHTKIISQVDFTVTLLKQLNMATSQFKWSRNCLNPYTKSFAYYAFVDGVGWVSPSLNFAYDYPSKSFNYFEQKNKTADTTQIIKTGKSYLQILFDEYLSY